MSRVTAKLSAPYEYIETCSQTYPGHKWPLPRADIQLAPYMPPPKQRVDQSVKLRVDTNVHTFQCTTNAPPIMNAPNPTQKRSLKLTNRMHGRQTWNNVPGSVPPITPIAPRHFIPNLPPTPVITPHRSPRTAGQPVVSIPTQIPCVQFWPVEGGLRNSNFFLQEAINFLTECVWANLPKKFTSTKLKSKSAPSCLDFAQVAMPMVHPTTGESISSYKRLMHDPATSEVWQMGFSKDFGGLVQGNGKTGLKGTNSIFVMTHNEIKLVPKLQTVTYVCVVVDFYPQKDYPHQIRIAAGGNLINYPGKLSTRQPTLPHPR
jgi:hypothetical protein